MKNYLSAKKVLFTLAVIITFVVNNVTVGAISYPKLWLNLKTSNSKSYAPQVSSSSGGGTTTSSGGGTTTSSGGSGGGTVTTSSGGSDGGTVTTSSGGTVTTSSGGTVTTSSGGTVTTSSGSGTTTSSGGGTTTSSGGCTGAECSSSGGTVTTSSGGTVTTSSGSGTTTSSGGCTGAGCTSSGGTVTTSSGGGTTTSSGGGTTTSSGGGTTTSSGGGTTTSSGGGTTTSSGGGTTTSSGGGTTTSSGGGTTTSSGGGTTTSTGGGTTTSTGGGTTTSTGGGTTTSTGGGTTTSTGGGTTTSTGGGTTTSTGGGTTTSTGGGTTTSTGGGTTTSTGGGTTTSTGGGTTTSTGGGTTTSTGGGTTTSTGGGTTTSTGGGTTTSTGGGTTTSTGGGTTTSTGGGTTTSTGGGTTTSTGGGTTTTSTGGGTTTSTGGGTTTTSTGGGVVTETVDTPTASPDSGNILVGGKVTLTTTTSGATIYYTINGLEPNNSNGQLYDNVNKVTINNSLTLKAIAYKAGYNPSAVMTKYYTVITNAAPIIIDIPNKTIDKGNTFTNIELDQYVIDAETPDNRIVWTVSGTNNLNIVISNRVAVITILNPNWVGSEVATFTARDEGGLTASDNVIFTVNAITNQAPVITAIPDQTIALGGTFAPILLDNYVADDRTPDANITWTFLGTNNLRVTLGANRTATITALNPNWLGTEAITFIANDNEGGAANDVVNFTVQNVVNTAPIVDNIPDQTISLGGIFALINLDNYVADAQDADSAITWTASSTGNNLNATINAATRVATINIINQNWVGSETITFTARDTSGLTASDTATFTINNNGIPVAPSNVTLLDVTDTTANVSWQDNSNNETGFALYLNGSWINTALPNTTSFNLIGLQPNTEYEYFMRAINNNGNSPDSNHIRFITANSNSAPRSPTNLQASNITTTSVNLQWVDNSNDETNFIVYQNGNLIATLGANVTTYTVSNLNPATAYTFYVRAFSNNGISGSTNFLTITTAALDAPLAPTVLSVNNITDTSLTLSWTDNSNDETGFRIYRNGIAVADTATNVSTYNMVGLAPNTTYQFYVRAFKNLSESPSSNTLSVTTLNVNNKPLAPTNLAVSSLTSNSLTLTWTDNANNETAYKVFQNTVELLPNLGANTTAYNIINLMPNTTYTFYTVASNNGVNSDNSNSVTVITAVSNTAPASPTNLRSPAQTATSIDLTWTDNSNNETNFIVYQNGNEIATLGANVVNYTVNGLVASTQYNFYVRARNAGGELSGSTNFLTVSTAGLGAPTAPTNLQASNTTTNSTDLTWTDNSANETGFRIYQNGALVKDVSANVITTTVPNLNPSTTYVFKVTAFNASGESTASNEVTITTGVAPAVITYSSGGGGGGGGGNYKLNDCDRVYKMPVSLSNAELTTCRPIDFSASKGDVTRPLIMENFYNDHKATFGQSDKVKVCDTNKQFEGILYTPKSLSVSQSKITPPSGSQILKIVDFTAENDQDVCFEPESELGIKFYATGNLNPKLVSVYLYNPKTQTLEALKVPVTVNEAKDMATFKITKSGIYVLTYGATGEIDEHVFKDLKDHWARECIEDLTVQGVFDKKEYIYPNSNSTRAEVAKMIAVAFNHDTSSSFTPFPDVSTSQWYAPYIAAGYNDQFLFGYPDGNFRPQNTINRVEALQIILLGSELDNFYGSIAYFNDVPREEWFAKYVGFAFENGITQGRSENKFDPPALVTKAEAASMICRIQQHINLVEKSTITKLEATYVDKVISGKVNEEIPYKVEMFDKNGEKIRKCGVPVWCQYSLDQSQWYFYGKISFTDANGDANCTAKINDSITLDFRGYRQGVPKNDNGIIQLSWY